MSHTCNEFCDCNCEECVRQRGYVVGTHEVIEELVSSLEQQRERWLNETGSGDVQTRSGYIEAMNDAIRIVSARG